MKTIIDSIIKHLEQKESFVLVKIIDQQGSAPRDVGTQMIVSNNAVVGTVGGGKLEGEIIDISRQVHQEKQGLIKEYNLTQEDAAQEEMICGGRVEFLVEYIDAVNPENLSIYSNIKDFIQNRQEARLITIVSVREAEKVVVRKCLAGPAGLMTGNYTCDSELLDHLNTNYKQFYRYIASDNNIIIIEPILCGSTAYVIGAGHIGQKLVPLLNKVGFKTVVMDDREDFANRERFSRADQIILLETFAQVFQNCLIDRNSYIIIVTRGHIHDKTVLQQALLTKAGYIGMIGSRKKKAAIYQALIDEGVQEDELKQVYCPIGLDIKAETPEEIAVSIVAELIKARAENQ